MPWDSIPYVSPTCPLCVPSVSQPLPQQPCSQPGRIRSKGGGGGKTCSLQPVIHPHCIRTYY